MKSNNINTAILMATLVMPATGVMAAENNATPVSLVKSTPFTTVYFAPRTQYRTASKGFLQRLMLTGVVQDSDSIFKICTGVLKLMPILVKIWINGKVAIRKLNLTSLLYWAIVTSGLNPA
ncbi:hypothetical protein RM437_10575 [Citrobacter werkmanii]|uniref:hypothetical protein n=1 Tax=Citrobacter werkmanii TaxID=67827 RepID=UPI00288484E8|nr:hypothetical protein [Citrobacter werkmanii]MDT0638471.1 hypothetical protein [Citrobacter werkmanii]